VKKFIYFVRYRVDHEGGGVGNRMLVYASDVGEASALATKFLTHLYRNWKSRTIRFKEIDLMHENEISLVTAENIDHVLSYIEENQVK
jgi:hypothetical protein